ncbi:MAG: O-antigen ligase family protein [Ginsengibacter sp.]
MIKKSLDQNAISDYILVILLLVFSGNPITRFFDKSALMILSILIFIIKYRQLKKDFFAKFFLIASALLVVFMLQNIILNFVSWLGVFRYIFTFFLGGLIFFLVSERFSFRFFIVLYYLSLVSLLFFVLINLLHVNLPALNWGDSKRCYIIYTYVERLHADRNCGMFWEPGAFAGILTLCMALNANHFPALWKKHKLKIVVLVITLLTTKSTTGYLVFFIIVIYYLVFFVKSNIIKFALVPALLLIMVIVYENTDFLKEKIIEQSERTSGLSRGEFANSRFSSFVLDLPYIKKHPFIGNGINEKTRYADDPLLMQQMKSGESLGNANGFSNTLASMGIPFMFFYLLAVFKTMNKVDIRVAFLVVFVMVLILWGEQWLNYPIFTGILFLKIKKYINQIRPYPNFNSLSYQSSKGSYMT